MVKTFIFDEKSTYWSHDREVNKSFIQLQIRWIYEYIKLRGYVYLDMIYGTFGDEWNPDEPNDCIRYGVNGFVMSWTDLGNNQFEIKICY